MLGQGSCLATTLEASASGRQARCEADELAPFSGAASGGKNLAWLFTSDVDCVVMLAASGKTLTTLAEIACEQAAQNGLTEMSVDDHDVKQKLEDGS